MPDNQNTLLGNNSSPPAAEFDPKRDYYAELTGPGGKFHDPNPDIAKQKVAFGKMHGDEYTKFKEQQFDELRSDYLKIKAETEAVPRLQELLDQLKSQPPRDELPPPPMSNPEVKPVNMDEIKNEVQTLFQQMKQEDVQTQNFKQVQNKLVERFGNNYQTQLAKQANELGMSGDEVEAMARRNPKLFERTFGLDQPVQTENFQAPPRSGTRTDSFAPKEQKRTWTYYQNLKKENPSLYLSNKTQWQMHQDAINLGDDFKDGDYNAL